MSYETSIFINRETNIDQESSWLREILVSIYFIFERISLFSLRCTRQVSDFQTTIFWDVMPLSLVDVFFGGMYYVHLQVRRVSQVARRASRPRKICNNYCIFIISINRPISVLYFI
jgi:hypothetical protein